MLFELCCIVECCHDLLFMHYGIAVQEVQIIRYYTVAEVCCDLSCSFIPFMLLALENAALTISHDVAVTPIHAGGGADRWQTRFF